MMLRHTPTLNSAPRFIDNLYLEVNLDSFLDQVPDVSNFQVVSSTTRSRGDRTHASAEFADWAAIVAG